MEHTTDVVIVGGGVIGCAIAYYLRKANVDVMVLDEGEIGGQASSAAAGLLAPLGPLTGPGPFADLLLASFALFPSVVPELEDLTGLDLGYEQTGALRTVSNPKRVSNLQQRMEAWQPLGLKMQWLTGDEARQMEPLLAPGVCAAIYVPEESQIKAPQIVKAFANAAVKLGAKIYSHKKVTSIQREENKVTGVKTAEGDTIACDHMILTTGAWTGLYDSWLDISLPVVPHRGQIISMKQPATALRYIIFGGSAYLVPRDGSIIIGATKEEVGFDIQVTNEGLSWLYKSAAKLVPSLQGSKAELSWAGLRPKTPDKYPILGAAPGWQNVTLAVGHNSVGVILSIITGQSIAQLVTTKETSEITLPFSLNRFVKKHSSNTQLAQSTLES
ncbi:glycine oxidase ThiO [Dictyobacter aurantiacus]|uniref:glycine oxidase n=1 Tax=Dictyobacter aurantiacus TaxID=1936993 RepID=A0A401ZFU8_9CHLR|nr:glycine oxidase ThiO [Dictyobacter aurantiacus]GCE05770.1 glycine oxidase ThiO [Dictyobacter aurantiacus]